jgi:hypothetical protein
MKNAPLPQIGDRFGRWTVVEGSGLAARNVRLVMCKCDCGTERLMRPAKLRNGHSRSCGCLRLDEARMRKTTHGASETKVFRVWATMISRCHNPNADAYKKYGARGIYVCAEWRASFERFLADMGDRPQGSQIDRVDNNGPYAPSNCRWATPSEQSRNRRSTKFVAINGETRCIAEWLTLSGISWNAYRARKRMGWDLVRSITTPIHGLGNETKRGPRESRIPNP